MGVRGLSAFFSQNSDLSKSFKLRDSTVIFDGNNIIHALYFNYNLNCMQGGDYRKYADGVKRYMSVFLECNITPILIFDGGYEKSDKKLKTTISRAKTRLTQVQHIARYGYCSGSVLPILAYEVFCSVLRELNIKYAQCDYEADDQITALANYYKCPVISGDSDFYIFDIHHGFIHIRTIDMTVKVKKDSNGKEYKFLNCSIYYTDEFISYFPGLNKRALPLFGTLMGNDYVQESEFDNFFANIQLPKYKGKKLITSSKQRKMMGLLSWLQRISIEKAVDLVILYLKKDKRDYIKTIIEDSVNGYSQQNVQLSLIINNNIPEFTREISLNSKLLTPCGSSLPSKFIVKFHQGIFPAFFINVIVLHRVFLQPQIESISADSSYSCSLYIRQIVYGILVRHNCGIEECMNESCLAPIEEYDRQHKNLRKEFVKPTSCLKNFELLPKLDETEFINSDISKSLILSVLHIQPGFLSDVPDEWQLFLCVISYWINNSLPHVSESCINALAINLIYFSLIKAKIAFYKCKCLQFGAIDKCECLTISSLLSKIEDSNLQYASKNLEKYVKKSSFNNGNPLLLDIVHSYSQLQTCVLYVIYLNKLLGNCMINPIPEKCFSGTMIYNMAKDISTRPNPELFLAETLGRDSNLLLLFKELCLKMCENVSADKILKCTFSRKGGKRSKKNRNASSNYVDNPSNNLFDVLKEQADANL